MLLITGGAGYIGSHFVDYYLQQSPDHSVVLVDSLITGHQDAVSNLGFSDRLHFVHADIGDKAAMRAIFEQHAIEAVVHFAAAVNVGESSENPLLYYQNNVANSLSLFEVMEEAGVRRLVFSSTCATYGDAEYSPLDEKHSQNPTNVYGRTKLVVEYILRDLHQYKGWSCIPLRYFNAAGASSHGQIGESHHPETHLIPLVLQVATGTRESISIFGDDYPTRDGTCIRDYIHVTDLAQAHYLALQHIRDNQVFEPINLGTANGVTVREIIEACRDVTGKDIAVEVKGRRLGDPPSLVANYEKAKTLLGWNPVFSVNDTIRSAWQWEQNRKF